MDRGTRIHPRCGITPDDNHHPPSPTKAISGIPKHDNPQTLPNQRVLRRSACRGSPHSKLHPTISGETRSSSGDTRSSSAHPIRFAVFVTAVCTTVRRAPAPPLQQQGTKPHPQQPALKHPTPTSSTGATQKRPRMQSMQGLKRLCAESLL